MNLTVMLFVPGDRPERFQKALDSGANAAIVDLEDAVGPANKTLARGCARKALGEGLRAFVRVNPGGGEFGVDDLKALAKSPPLGILVPKVERPKDVREAASIAPVIALLESVRAFRRADEIASERNVVALGFGAFDLCAELGAQPTPEVLAPYRSATVAAARLAGILAIDAPFLGIGDDAGLRADARRALEFGFDGKLAIHPSQVAPIAETFAPSDDEIAHARAVLAALSAGGVAVVNGKMVDPPIIASAQRVLARASTRTGATA